MPEANQSAPEPQSQPHDKPLLTVPEQIAHLKSKGVTFNLCTEHEAAAYLADRTYYFKLTAYRTLFEKRVGGPRDGQYVNLDFGHLRALASLDRDLRYALLPLTLDVEHAARTKLARLITEREDEDGYSVSADYMASLSHKERNRREGEVAMLSNDVFCGDLVAKYGKPANMPAWVLMELFSFGSFASLYLFCANRWDDNAMRDEHYMLRQAQFVRNACAHSSNMANGFADQGSDVGTNAMVERALAKTGLSHRVRTSKMRNPRLKQIATLLYLHSCMVPSGSGRRRAIADMSSLQRSIAEVLEMLPGNDRVQSSLGFLSKLIDSWF